MIPLSFFIHQVVVTSSTNTGATAISTSAPSPIKPILRTQYSVLGIGRRADALSFKSHSLYTNVAHALAHYKSLCEIQNYWETSPPLLHN